MTDPHIGKIYVDTNCPNPDMRTVHRVVRIHDASVAEDKILYVAEVLLPLDSPYDVGAAVHLFQRELGEEVTEEQLVLFALERVEL